jgi:hypothetical protein
MKTAREQTVDSGPFGLIAERALVAKSDKGIFEIKVRFGKPTPHLKGDWFCPYQIIGLGRDEVRNIFGIDAVQALQLAMFAAGAELEQFSKTIKLSFLDEDNLGFPRSTKEATGNCPYCGPGETA